VERYQGKPFALLGVNIDNSPSRVREFQDAGMVTWRSFSGDVNEVALAYGVHTIPMVVLIDHKGIVREAWVMPNPEELDRKVEELVTAAEGGG
jgi:hypothetical protein